MDRFRVVLFGMLIALQAAHAGDRTEGKMFATRSVVYARNGMVAASHPLAVSIGVDVLKRGGSAVDAAIAANAALGFLEPTACGIGGDLFAIVWDAQGGKLHGLNGSGRSPLKLTADEVTPAADGTIPRYSPFAWSVPGAVDGWFALHARFGKLPMAELLQPAIEAAERGEPVPQAIAAAWDRSIARFGGMPGFDATFLPGGRAPREGEVFRNPDLAKGLPRAGQGRACGLLQRRHRPGHRRVLRTQRRIFLHAGSRAARLGVGRAAVDDVSRCRGVRAPPERPGAGRAADAQHAGALRPAGDGTRFGRFLAHDDRGQEAGLRGPGALLCRPGVCRAADRRAPVPRLRAPARRVDRPRARRQDVRGPATPDWPTATRRTWRRRMPAATWSR